MDQVQSRKLNIAIIGCGIIAPVHLQIFQSFAYCQVSWLCDIKIERAQAMAERFNIPRTTTDYQELLKDSLLDAIVICTPHDSHAEMVCQSISAGKHVLCEKPLAISFSQLDQIKDCLSQSQSVFSGVFQHRFDPVYVWLKKLIQQDQLGKLISLSLEFSCLRDEAYYKQDDWRGTWAGEGGSLLINQAIHYLDILIWIFGKPRLHSCFIDNQQHRGIIETEDCAAIILLFKNNLVCTINAISSSKIKPWKSRITVNAETVFIQIENDQLKEIQSLDNKSKEDLLLQLKNKTKPQDLDSKQYYGDGHFPQIENFLKAIYKDGRVKVDFSSCRRTMNCVLTILDEFKGGMKCT